MNNSIRGTWTAVSALLGLVFLGQIAPAVADDTEIYRAQYDSTAPGARPKVLIVFDDSGSMDELRDGERPEYDSTESYNGGIPNGRIYWSTNGQPPEPGDDRWFPATANRCEVSKDLLDDNGVFTATRARRWVDSDIQQGQCRNECPAGSIYRNPPGPNNAGCYEEVTTTVYADKLVPIENDRNGNRCRNGLTYVDPPGGNNDYCYDWVSTETNTDAGYVYRFNDNGNYCPPPTVRLYVDPPGRNNAGDACYESVTGPVTTEETSWSWVGPRVQVCEEDTVVPGNWAALNDNDHDPTHVECRDDQDMANPGNGSGIPDGYPQNNVTNGNEFGSTPDGNVDWGDVPYTFYTSHYLDYLYDDSLVTQRTKLAIAQDVVSDIITTNPGVDFGLLEFNYEHGGRIAHRIIENMTAAQRTNLVSLVNQMDHSGATPMCESLWEAYRYMGGLGVDYGYSAKSGSDSRGVHDVLAMDMAAINTKGTSSTSDDVYIQPNTECNNTYIILMSDGFPSRDTGANSDIEDLTGETCSRYVDADGNNTKNCLPELAKYMAENDLDEDTTNGTQRAITYTIGFDLDQQLLYDTGNVNSDGKNRYYTAFSALELSTAFQSVLTDILSETSTFTSPAVAVDTFTRTQSRNEVFYAMFKPGNSTDWIGNIKKLNLVTTNDGVELQGEDGEAAIDPVSGKIKDSAITVWGTAADGGEVGKGGVGEILAARTPSSRSIYINTGSGGALEALNTTNIDAAAMGVANDAALWSLFGVSTSAAFADQIAWANGWDAYDEDKDGTTNETRPWVLGDILHSQPLVINYGALGSATVADPDLRIVSGTNAGFVHMFNNSDGAETWAFFPKELAELLPIRRRDAISNENVYGMDLTPVLYSYDGNRDGTIDASAGDKAWIYMGMRRGGESYYALDVSNPNSPSFMWRIGSDTAGFSELGQTWSEPVVTRIPGYRDLVTGIPKPVLIFGAGYDTNKDGSGLGSNDSKGRGLFIVDAQTGALVWSVTPAANSTTNMQEVTLLDSVPGNVSILDSNGDELTDRIYFGDTGGNLWRVDMAGNTLPTSSQDTWFITKVANFNGSTVSSDIRFFNAPDIVRIRQNGKPVDAVIIGSGDRTNPNATDVDNGLYLVRDEAVVPYATERPDSATCAEPETVDFRCSLPLDTSDLFDISSNILNTGTETEREDAQTALNSAQGWYMELPGSGEKSLARTITINGTVFASTYTPPSLSDLISVCEPQYGTGQMYIIDLYSGDRSTIYLGSIIPDAPSLHFAEDGTIRVLLPPGAPETEVDEPSLVDCSGGICDVNESLRAPYGNYWYQEAY